MQGRNEMFSTGRLARDSRESLIARVASSILPPPQPAQSC